MGKQGNPSTAKREGNEKIRKLYKKNGGDPKMVRFEFAAFVMLF